MPQTTKNFMLRLDPELAAQLQAVADVEDRPVSEIVREAIRDLVAARRKDKRFQRRLQESARQYGKLLDQLRSDAR